MARPRVFISSTYFDLKSIREELDRFIVGMGYEPVRHEVGHIAYGRESRPEEYAFREIEFCDILVSIVGSRFGTNAADSAYSISQEELKRAHAQGKQVYIFIERGVYSEFRFYQTNKGVAGVKYNAVTDTRIFEFIEEVYGLSKGNPIFSFETGTEIVAMLREQWAGQFQRLLGLESAKTQATLIEQLQRGLQTVDQMVKFLQEDHSKNAAAFQQILLSNHPVFTALKEELQATYRIYFENYTELSDWLLGSRSMRAIDEENMPAEWRGDYFGWTRRSFTRKDAPVRHQQLYVSKAVFDTEGRLKPMGQSDWRPEYIAMEITDNKPGEEDDDIPF